MKAIIRLATVLLAMSICTPLVWSGLDMPCDSVLINGQAISIRADVEIDSTTIDGSRWRDFTDFAFLFRANAQFNHPELNQGDLLVQTNNTHLPEFSFELTSPFSFKKYRQLNYRAGVTVGFSSRFIEDDLDPDLIGFNLNGRNLEQIILVKDDLNNLADTANAPFVMKPNFKINCGIEWHGVMRRARGWRVGAMVEYTPVKDQYVEMQVLNLPSDQWGDIESTETYEIDEAKTNFLKLRVFASWSPWNTKLFIRGSALWSPTKTEGAISLGYHF